MHRPRWIIGPAFLIVIPFVAGWNVAASMLFGAVLGGLLTLAVDVRFIALTPTRRVLLTASKFPVTRPRGVDRRLSPSSVQFLDSAGFNRALTIDGRRYVVSRFYVSRLELLLSQPVSH